MRSRDPAVNPDFYTWNHVFVPYCTGDVWVGMMNTSANPWGSGTQQFFFSGHTILKTLVKELMQLHSLGSKANADEEVLFAGCSAGGIGTFNNLDWYSTAHTIQHTPYTIYHTQCIHYTHL
jgi:hypothetical protein